jgi:hypothetical protein
MSPSKPSSTLYTRVKPAEASSSAA